ncbi:MAG: hypothetical protein NUW37_01450 [Planctomycetes bacterium]|nr:hypothetical protein [Planctomycetota bacterium]
MSGIRPRLQCLVLCEQIVQRKWGKKDLLGVTDQLYATKFPHREANLSVFAVLGFGQGEFEVSCEIVDTVGNAVYRSEEPAQIRLDDPFRRAEFLLTLRDVIFPGKGTYYVSILVGGVKLAPDLMLLLDQI